MIAISSCWKHQAAMAIFIRLVTNASICLCRAAQVESLMCLSVVIAQMIHGQWHHQCHHPQNLH